MAARRADGRPSGKLDVVHGELTPEGIQQYGGGYTEYVARTGHEAPGLHA
jgi:hypothetical protein